MMREAELLAECEKLGIRIEARPERHTLCVEPIAALPAALRERLVENKPVLLAFLAESEGKSGVRRAYEKLSEAGLYRDGKNLRVRQPENLTHELRECMIQYRSELVFLLTPREVGQTE